MSVGRDRFPARIDSVGDLREIDLHIRSDIEIVGKNVQDHVDKNFGDLGFGIAGLTDGTEVGGRQPGRLFRARARRRSEPRWSSHCLVSLAACDDLFGFQSHKVPDHRVRRQTVIAVVLLRGHEHQSLARLGVWEPSGQCAAEAEMHPKVGSIEYD